MALDIWESFNAYEIRVLYVIPAYVYVKGRKFIESQLTVLWR